MPIKKLQALPKTLLQALKDYFNNYLSYKSSKDCINRRGYWQMLAIVVPCHILAFNVADYLDSNFASPHSFDLQSFISAPYFIPSCLLLLFYIKIIVVFFIISDHRCRDIGISTGYTLLVLVPFINIAFIIILGCRKTGAAKKHNLGKNKKTDR